MIASFVRFPARSARKSAQTLIAAEWLHMGRNPVPTAWHASRAYWPGRPGTSDRSHVVVVAPLWSRCRGRPVGPLDAMEEVGVDRRDRIVVGVDGSAESR